LTFDRELYPLCSGGWNLHADPVCWHCADCGAKEPGHCIYIELAKQQRLPGTDH
jgi:hypothetical protein